MIRFLKYLKVSAESDFRVEMKSSILNREFLHWKLMSESTGPRVRKFGAFWVVPPFHQFWGCEGEAIGETFKGSG